MGIFDSLIEGGINAITGGDAPTGGDAVAAYKGDGVMGLGTYLSGLANAYGVLEIKDSQTTDRLKAYVRQWLDNITQYLQHKYNNNSDYSKCDAITEAAAAVKGTFYDFRQNLPNLLVDCQYGIYNSTATQQLLNDAYARAVEKASSLRMQAVVDFRRLNIEGDRLPLDAIGRQIESWTQFNQDRSEERSLNLSEFAKDAATIMIATTVLSIFTNRKYKVDDSTGGIL